VHIREPGVLIERPPDRIEQQRTGLRDPATNNSQIQVTQSRSRRDRQPNRAPRAVERSPRHFIISQRRGRKVSSIGMLRRTPPMLTRPPHKMWPTRDGLNTSTRTTTARQPIRLNNDMPDMSGITGPPTIRTPMKNKSTANTSGHNKPN
jgi:hypothetical protein